MKEAVLVACVAPDSAVRCWYSRQKTGECIMQALSMQQGALPSRLLIFTAGCVVGMQAREGLLVSRTEKESTGRATVEAIVAV